MACHILCLLRELRDKQRALLRYPSQYGKRFKDLLVIVVSVLKHRDGKGFIRPQSKLKS